MYSVRKKYELSDLLSFPPTDLPSLCQTNRFAREYCENDNIWKEQLFSEVDEKEQRSITYQVEIDAKKLGYKYFELYTSDEPWKNMFLLRVKDPSVNILDVVILELMDEHQLTWKQLYMNRIEDRSPYWKDVANTYIDWLSELTRKYSNEIQLTRILGHIGYLDQHLFTDLFDDYTKEVGNRVATYKTILMYTLNEYGKHNRHNEFEPLLEFLMDRFFSSSKDPNRPVELAILVSAIAYHDCYYPAFVDYIIERFDPYLADYDSWDTLLLLILSSVIENMYVSETHDPVLFMNKIMFGTKYSFKDELEIISEFGGKQSYKGIPYLEDIFGMMKLFRNHQVYLDESLSSSSIIGAKRL